MRAGTNDPLKVDLLKRFYLAMASTNNNTTQDGGGAGHITTAPTQSMSLVTTVSNTLTPLALNLYHAQAQDYGDTCDDILKIVFEVAGGDTKIHTKVKRIKDIKVLKTFLEPLIGVAIIRDLTVNISFSSPGQFVMVGLKGDDASVSAMSDMTAMTSIKSFVCGNNLTGVVPVALEETQAFSLQVKGTCITAPSAVIALYAINSFAAPFIVTVQGRIERAGTNLLQEQIPF
jgi:hypothetical protein